MKVHLVGGFLGSGKTTSIIAACKIFAERGARAGVITNDQGRYLVDTAFVRAESVPAMEVAGGCFCCRFSDFSEMIREIDASAHPDHVFAESVGSCADIVATVVRPSDLEGVDRITSFTVFTDVRLLGLWLHGGALPFADEVVYLYGKQLEEAGLIVVNKSDLVSREEGEAVRGELARRFPEKPILLQSALSRSDISQWVARIAEGAASAAEVGLSTLDIDYPRYAAAEASLAWFDAHVRISAGESPSAELVEAIAEGIVSRARGAGYAIGHLKLFVVWEGGSRKLGATAPDRELDWDLPDMGRGEVELAVNARVQCLPEELSVLVHASLQEAASRFARRFSVAREEAFRPSYPSPTHRIPG